MTIAAIANEVEVIVGIGIVGVGDVDVGRGIVAVLVVWDACAATRCDKGMGKRIMCGK